MKEVLPGRSFDRTSIGLQPLVANTLLPFSYLIEFVIIHNQLTGEMAASMMGHALLTAVQSIIMRVKRAPTLTT